MTKFELNDRQKEILGLLNEVFLLGIPLEEISTLKGASEIYSWAKELKISALHELGIARRSLKKIGYQIMVSRGQPPNKSNFEDDFDPQFDFIGDLVEAD